MTTRNFVGRLGQALALTASLALSLSPLPVSAEWQGPNAQPWFENTARPQGYNYAPSVISEGGNQDVWWCGQGQTDVIYHRTYNASSGFGPIQLVFNPRQAWNSAYTCDPSVVKGNFTNPQDGQHYQYVMYYSGANNLPGNNNQLGLAYSNDKVNWVDYQGPVLQPLGNASDNYGLGQPSTFNADGQSSLFVITTDTSVPADPNFAQIFVRHTPDGVNFEAPVRVPGRATDGTSVGPNSDFAYDYSTGDVYMMSSLPGRNCAAEPCKDPVNNKDRETYQMALYKMPISQFLSGQPYQWTPLGQLSSDQTGYYLNHSPGFNRDPSGNITPFFPNIQIVHSGGDPSPTTWKLTFSVLNKDNPFAPINRYYNGSIHKVTSGYAGPGFNYEMTLGRALVAATAATHKVYQCFTGGDYFLSTAASCEGQQHLGVTGEFFNNNEPNTHAIYRCLAGNHHFASNDPGCEGQTVEGPLGYVYNN